MRTIIRTVTVLSLLTLPALAIAQENTTTPPATPPAATAAVAAAPQAKEATSAVKSGSVDFGAMGSIISGDAARYNRYRDLSDGAFFDNFRTRVETNGWFMNVAADRIARQDGRYGASFVRPGTFKGAFQWDQIRTLVSTTTRTLYTEVTPGAFRIDDNVQTLIANAFLGTPNTGATVLPAALAQYAHPFTLGTDRHIASGSFQYLTSPDTTVSFDVSRTNRTGNLLYSGTFGMSNQTDNFQPISQHTTTATLSYEHQAGNALIRAGFTGSYFRNDLSTFVWDSPYRVVDTLTVSTSSQPSQGRTSVNPSNNWNVFNGSVSYKMKAHSRATAYVALGFLNDNGAILIPESINQYLFAPLARNAVGGEARTQNVNLSFVSHPVAKVSFDVRYKVYNYDNRTPEFFNAQRVSYDGSYSAATLPATLAASDAEHAAGKKQAFNADLHYVLPFHSSAGIGYTRNQANYQERLFTGSHEDAGHVSFDTMATQYFSLHTKYERAIRRGIGLDTTDLAGDGEQTTMRHYDIADRNRDLFTFAATAFPVNGLSVEFTVGTGKDEYPTTMFGLTSADHDVYGVSFDADPNEHVSLTMGASWDSFKSVQWNRSSLTDASKGFSDTGRDKTQNVYGSLSFLRLADKVDIRFGYDGNRGRGSYVYFNGSAPGDLVVPTTLAAPTQLPGLVSDLRRGTFDITYALTSKVSLGGTFWYEDFRVADFALDANALPTLNLGTTAVFQGYQYLPYTAKTVFGRLVCHW